MRVVLTLEDDLGEFYKEEAAARKIPIEQVLEDRLAHAGELDPRTRYVIVAGMARQRLEDTLGGGSLQGAADLAAKVGRLARIKFGDHEIRLTPGQLEEIAYRAKRQGKTPEQMIKEMWERIQDQFFMALP